MNIWHCAFVKTHRTLQHRVNLSVANLKSHLGSCRIPGWNEVCEERM